METERLTTNAAGGKQHAVEHRCEALFPRAQLEIARLRAHGHDVIGYEDDNYRKITPLEHVGRAIRHLLLFLIGDTEDGSREEHLVHAACRIEMAIEMIKSGISFDETETCELEQLREVYGYDARER